jgi:ubiquinone/menaquinone biosynthesis C-methylase UbiE
MIDVKDLIEKYSVQELIASADAYYERIEHMDILAKPFRLPDAQHLLTEVGQLISGLKLHPGDHVVDFGCGTGWAGRLINACGCKVTSVDVAANALVVAKDLTAKWRNGLPDGNRLPPHEFALFDGFRIDLPDNSVDKIFTLDSFHHVPNPRLVLEEFFRILKPGGIVGFCEPGPNHSKSPSSQLEMKLHTVIECDIVIEDIWANAQDIGFGGIKLMITPLMGWLVDYQAYSDFPNNPKVLSDFVGATNFRAKNFPIFFLYKPGSGKLTSETNDGLSHAIKLVVPQDGLTIGRSAPPLRLHVANTGKASWLPSGAKRGSVTVGIIATDSKGRSKQLRSHLSDNAVDPGTKLELDVFVNDLPAGDYILEIDLVSEFVCWFHEVGAETIKVSATAV